MISAWIIGMDPLLDFHIERERMETGINKGNMILTGYSMGGACSMHFQLKILLSFISSML